MTGSKFRGILGFFERARPAAAMERGRKAYERGDYAAALKEWSAAASTGNPEASYRLGLLYARGHGLLANLADAAAWYRRAAEEGHAAAQHQLSLLHLDGYRAHAWTSFARWYGAAAKRDPEAADHNRALLFPNGYEVSQYPAEALRWSRAAAEQGITDAQANTGLIYARGIRRRRRTYLDMRDRRRMRLPGSPALVRARCRSGQRRRATRSRHPLRQWPRCRERPFDRRQLVRESGREGQCRGASGARIDVPLGPGYRPRHRQSGGMVRQSGRPRERPRPVQSGAARSGR